MGKCTVRVAIWLGGGHSPSLDLGLYLRYSRVPLPPVFFLWDRDGVSRLLGWPGASFPIPDVFEPTPLHFEWICKHIRFQLKGKSKSKAAKAKQVGDRGERERTCLLPPTPLLLPPDRVAVGAVVGGGGGGGVGQYHDSRDCSCRAGATGSAERKLQGGQTGKAKSGEPVEPEVPPRAVPLKTGGQQGSSYSYTEIN